MSPTSLPTGNPLGTVGSVGLFPVRNPKSHHVNSGSGRAGCVSASLNNMNLVLVLRLALAAWRFVGKPSPVRLTTGSLFRAEGLVRAFNDARAGLEDWEAQWAEFVDRYSVWAPATVTHVKGYNLPREYLDDLRSWWLGCAVVLATVFLSLTLGFVLVRAFVLPGDLGLWATAPRVLPGTRATRTATMSPSEAWVLQACGGIVPVASVLKRRLRRRARWVRVVEAVLGTRYGTLGQLVKGKWVPDHIPPGAPQEVAWLLGTVENGVRLLGGGVIAGRPSQADGLKHCGRCLGKAERDCSCPAPSPVKAGDEQLYLVVEIKGEISVVFPFLLAKLRLYALCRQRNEQLLGALRTRAVEWCKAASLDEVTADLAVSGSLGLAMLPSTSERVTRAQVARAMAEPPFPHALG